MAHARFSPRWWMRMLGIFAIAFAISAAVAGAIAFWPPRVIDAPKPNAEAPLPVPPMPATQPTFFDGWEQDFAKARTQAAQEKKDVLILFDGSDWCPYSMQLADDVMSHASFLDGVRQAFVPVIVDFPQNPPALAKVRDRARNETLAQQFWVNSYPTIILTDPEGLPYAFEGTRRTTPADFLAGLLKLRDQLRGQRDRLFDAATQAEGAAKLPPAKEALAFLRKQGLVDFYKPQLANWLELARRHDPKNEQGHLESFFAADWLLRLNQPGADKGAAVILLDEWKKTTRFKDGDVAALLHLYAGRLLAATGEYERALSYIQEGLAYKPADQVLFQTLTNSVSAIGLSSGTGVVVNADGLILTNFHVVGGPGKIFVRLPDKKGFVPAEVIASEPQRDLALVRITVPTDISLHPTRWTAPRMVNRGEAVAVFGYPLGDLFGAGLKLTTGVVSAPPEQGNNNLLILDVRVNPGNSGGPLCDAFGTIIGLVNARSFGGYGMALPGQDIDPFLRKHLKDYKPDAPSTKKIGWDDVDRIVSPSVVMILKAPAQAPAVPAARPDDKPRPPGTSAKP